MELQDQPTVSSLRKLLISAFIVFHFGSVVFWLIASGGGSPAPVVGLVAKYLHNTAQYQEWAMFAPNPLQINRYLGARVIFGRGNLKEYTFPRLSKMDIFEAWTQKRYRKYQQRMADLKNPAYAEDAARWIARQMNEPGNPPVRVTLFLYESPIPRHNRPELRDAGWVDYTALLRHQAVFVPTIAVDYLVQPEDLQ